ncbi:MAG: methyltransferase domain-containing protein [Phycisphaerae bacterium]|nr:methyltransferase domain-containing protein [Phycisphaerae bacterium]
MADQWTGEAVLKLARSYQDSQALLASSELGIFEALGPAAKTAEDLSGDLGLDKRGIEVILNALVSAGLLAKEGGAFSIPGSLVPFLSETDPLTVLPMVRHQATCAHRWDRLAEVARSGQPPSFIGEMVRDEVQQRAFIQAMHVIGRQMADRIVGILAPTRFRRALDVGGASGTYTIALLRAAPGMRVTLFDLPPVVEMARDRLTEEGLIDRADLACGDFYKDALPGGHDLVLLSAIIHQNSPQQNRALYAKCREALDPGGTLVIRDIVMDDSHTRPPGGAQFAINMLVGTEGGGTYSLAEIKADLEAAGFGGIELLQQGTWMDGLVMARRP